MLSLPGWEVLGPKLIVEETDITKDAVWHK